MGGTGSEGKCSLLVLDVLVFKEYTDTPMYSLVLALAVAALNFTSTALCW